jgi:RNA polymerase sigma factor (sigma-70 family)
MPKASLDNVLYHLHRLAAVHSAARLPDQALLERFLADHDETAFTALVERHGPMVLGVCRRVLRDAHHAEDACQAVFLVLARRAGSIRNHAALGSWLHGVAYRISCKLKASLARRAQPLPLDEPPQPGDGEEMSWRELQAILDAELQRLPEKLRAPIVLCYLEGKTRDEAAQQLGWSEGTLRGRLERGRHLLRGRLERRGLTLSAALCATGIAPNAAPAAVPAHLVIPLVKAAMAIAVGEALTAALIPAPVIALTEGVIHAMFLTKWKLVTALAVALSVLGLSSGVLARRALADRPAVPSVAAPSQESEPLQFAVADDRETPARSDKPNKENPAKGDRPAAENPRKGDRPAGENPKKGERDGEERPSYNGVVKSVDAAKGTITLILPRDEGQSEERTFAVAKDARIVAGGKEAAALADIRAGTRVVLLLSEDRKSVVAIKEARDAGGRAAFLRGELKAVDAAKGTITVNARKREGGTGEDKTLPVDKEARIAIGGRKAGGKLADLKPGTEVSLRLSEDRKTVIGIQEVKRDGDREK